MVILDTRIALDPLLARNGPLFTVPEPELIGPVIRWYTRKAIAKNGIARYDI